MLEITFSKAIARLDLEGLSVWYPRDTFSAAGMYLPPPLHYNIQYDVEDDIKKSLKIAYSEFSGSNAFDPRDFDKKVLLTSMVLKSLE